jgi:hypothetical protein
MIGKTTAIITNQYTIGRSRHAGIEGHGKNQHQANGYGENFSH